MWRLVFDIGIQQSWERGDWSLSLYHNLRMWALYYKRDRPDEWELPYTTSHTTAFGWANQIIAEKEASCSG